MQARAEAISSIPLLAHTGRVVVILLAGVALVLTLTGGVNGDIKYEVGTQLTSPHDPAHTFTHRPLPYRLLMSALARPAAAVTDGYPSFETVLHVEPAILVLVAGIILRQGLRRYLPDAATTIALTTTGATLLMGASLAFEPDLIAVPMTIAGVGAGLLFRRSVPSALLAGGLLAAVAALKIVTLPVACLGLVGASRREALLVLGAAALALAPVVLQTQYYAYHFATFAAVAALCVLQALWRSGAPLLPPLLVTGMACGVLLSMPFPVRVGLAPLWFALAAAVSLGLALWQRRLLRLRGVAGRRPGYAAVTAAMLAVTLPAVLPTTAWSFSVQPAKVTTALSNAESSRTRALAGQRIRERIGADTVVTYLAFGDANYDVRNPTTCPTRPTSSCSEAGTLTSTRTPRAGRTTCAASTTNGQPWLVWDRSWFDLRRMPPEIRTRVIGSFDCPRGFKAARWTVCPRRADT